MKIETLILGPLSTNCYLVTAGSGEIAVIDPAADTTAFWGALAGRERDIALILLTHAHVDHIMAAAALAQRTGAPICAHALEEKRLQSERESLHHSLRMLFPEPQPQTACGWYVSDGDLLPLGDINFRVLHTPGHTDGSVCYLAGDALFSGDTLFYRSAGRTDFPTGDADTLHRSLVRLAALPGEYRVLPGHGPETTLSAERRENPFLRG